VIEARDFELCKEIIRFLGSISGDGLELEQLLSSMQMLDINGDSEAATPNTNA